MSTLIRCKSLATGSIFPNQLEDHYLKEDVFVNGPVVHLEKGHTFTLKLVQNDHVQYRVNTGQWIDEPAVDLEDFEELRMYLTNT